MKSAKYSSHWIRKLLNMGMEPLIDVLEEGAGDGWAEAEQDWIERLHEQGANLTNLTKGGEGTLGYVVELQKICRKCGARFNAHSVKAEYCDACCTFTCVTCGKSFLTRVYSRRHNIPRYCSSKCYGKGKLPVDKFCIHCGRKFTTTSNNARYCGECERYRRTHRVKPVSELQMPLLEVPGA